MGTSLPKGLRNSSMSTGQKNGNVFAKRCYKICQWVQDKKWEYLCQKMLRNSSMGTGQKMGTSLAKGLRNSSIGTGQIINHIYDKNDCFYDNLH